LEKLLPQSKSVNKRPSKVAIISASVDQINVLKVRLKELEEEQQKLMKEHDCLLLLKTENDHSP